MLTLPYDPALAGNPITCMSRLVGATCFAMMVRWPQATLCKIAMLQKRLISSQAHTASTDRSGEFATYKAHFPVTRDVRYFRATPRLFSRG